MRRLLRVLRRVALGDEETLARQAERRLWSPSLGLLRRFEREFGFSPGQDAVVFGRLSDPRARGRWVGLTRDRLGESHLAASGATGGGKTTAVMGLTRDMLRMGGVKLINIDPKGDTSAAVEGLVHEREGHPGAGSIKGEVKFIRPFDPQVVPQLRLTAPERGVPAGVTALSLVSGLEEATGAELGLRMRSIVTPLATLAIELDRPLGLVSDWLANPRAFADAAASSRDERLRSYARSQFPKESRESISAIRSRLESVLLLPVVRRALEARTFLPLEDWIERYHLNLDWSRPPAGQEAAVRALCGPVMGRLTRVLLNRSPGAESPHLWLLCDEAQEIIGHFETLSLGRLLALSRSRGVTCVFLFQQRNQLPRDLQELIKTNCAVELVFRANRRDALGYAHSLPVAEDEPNPAALRASLVRGLERLPRRHFLWIVKDSPLGGQFLEAPEICIPRVDPAEHRIVSCGDAVVPDKSGPREPVARVRFEPAPEASRPEPPVTDGRMGPASREEAENFPELG